MNIKRPKYLLQAALWILFYLLPYLLSYKTNISFDTIFKNDGDKIHLISFLFLIIYTYLNYFLLVPRFYFRKAYFFYFIMALACLLIVIGFPNVFFKSVQHHPPPSEGPMPILFGMNYNIIIFIISTFAAVIIRSRLQLFRIEKEKLDAELLLLKAQINPHFLFNTLNSIYALAIEKSDETPQAIIQLSDLMRYILSDSSAEYLDLNKELEYINNYVSLQKRRLGNTVLINYKTLGKTDKQKIAPLLLMSFIENTFKHGINPDEDSEISIDIQIGENELTLEVVNKKVHNINQTELSGMGLNNAIKRLQHQYFEKHKLLISDNEKMFSVKLSIVLK